MAPSSIYLGTDNSDDVSIEFILGATMNYSLFAAPIQEIKRQLRESFWIQLGIFLGSGIIFLLLAWVLTNYTTRLIINPISSLGEAQNL